MGTRKFFWRVFGEPCILYLWDPNAGRGGGAVALASYGEGVYNWHGLGVEGEEKVKGEGILKRSLLAWDGEKQGGRLDVEAAKGVSFRTLSSGMGHRAQEGK